MAPPVHMGVPVPRPQPAVPQQRPASMTLLYIWILLFGFVGTQLAWTLRPFFGDPGRPFALFRNTRLYGRGLGELIPLLSWCPRFRPATRNACSMDAA